MLDSRTGQNNKDNVTENRQFVFESNELIQLDANGFELPDVKEGHDWREDWHRHILEKYHRGLQ